jgi:polysaccharide biosynthesis/export protein
MQAQNAPARSMPAQKLAAPANPAEGTSPRSMDYRLGPGDVLKIGVYGVPELGRSTRISNSGKLHFPGVGVMMVAGMTQGDLSEEITKRLRESGQVKNPVVEVVVQQYRAQPVYILGEVMMPGQFVISDEMRVLDLLTLAAGFNEVASKTGYLYRRKLKDPNSASPSPEATSEDEAIPLDFPAITSGSHPELNLALRGGDILYVPVSPKKRYFVIGEVFKTGVFDLDSDEHLLASAALARAGGPQPTAKLTKGFVVRYKEKGEREEIAVDFGAILHGKKQDFEIHANDIIFIPGDAVKTLGYGLLTNLPSSAGRALVLH